MRFSSAFTLLLLLVFAQEEVFAQTETTPKSAELLKKKPSRNPDLEGIVLTYQMDFLRGFPDAAPYQYNQTRSGGFSFSIYWNQRFGQSNFSFAAGSGLSSRNYFTNVRNWKTGEVWADSLNVEKNKHVFTTFELPLELRYSTRPKGNLKSFKLSMGMNVGYSARIGSKTQLGPLTQKFKGTEDLLRLDPWRYAAIGRIGYHRLGISVYYGLSDWFKDNAVNGKPFSVGFSILL